MKSQPNRETILLAIVALAGLLIVGLLLAVCVLVVVPESTQVDQITVDQIAVEPEHEQPSEQLAESILYNRLDGKVIKIVDGDTLDILNAVNETFRIRLEGIDTPEKGQPYGKNADELLGQLTFGQTVEVKEVGTDRYGRILGRVFVDGVDVNHALVTAGLAWHYVKYSDDESLAEAELEARAAKIGIWSEDAPKPIAPWDWRKLSKEERDKLR